MQGATSATRSPRALAGPRRWTVAEGSGSQHRYADDCTTDTYTHRSTDWDSINHSNLSTQASRDTMRKPTYKKCIDSYSADLNFSSCSLHLEVNVDRWCYSSATSRLMILVWNTCTEVRLINYGKHTSTKNIFKNPPGDFAFSSLHYNNLLH